MQKANAGKQEEEMDKVKKVLKEDGLLESDPMFAHALIICRNTLHRRNLLTMETKEGCLNFLQICWEDRRSGSK